MKLVDQLEEEIEGLKELLRDMLNDKDVLFGPFYNRAIALLTGEEDER